MRRDVTIEAPVARLEPKQLAPNPLEVPTPEELYKLTHAALKQERIKSSEMSDFVRQVSSLALCLARMLADQNLADERGRILIPRELHREMLGASLEVGELADGQLFVRIGERERDRLHLAQ